MIYEKRTLSLIVMPKDEKVFSERATTIRVEDEAGGDEKLLCVPDDKTFPYYSDVKEKEDLPEIVMQQIEHFFTHYKDLEKDKWVRVGTWGGAEDARRITIEAIERAKAEKPA